MNNHRLTTKPKKIVVIGAGIAGLASAARLAKRGHNVTVFEASSRTGGKCRTEKIDRFSFDTGPSLLTLPAVYRDLFLKTGKRIEHRLQINPVDPAFEYIFHDGTVITFPNLSRRKTIDAIGNSLGDEAAAEWNALMGRAEKMWDVSRNDFIESEMPSIFSFLTRKSFLSDIRVIAPYASLRKVSRKYISNPYLQKIVDRYATYTGSDPREVPAVLLSIAFVEEAFGAWHIAGGIGSLSVALEERVRHLGSEIHLSTPVSKILTRAGRAYAIKLESGEVIEADIIVANADAYLVYHQLLANERATRKPQKDLKRAVPSLSGFTLLLGLKGKSAVKHHTVYFPENYDDEFDSIFHRSEPVKDPAIYICNPQDPEISPEGFESWTVLINAPRHSSDQKLQSGFNWETPGVKERYAEHIIDLMEDKGLDVRSRLEYFAIRTPLDLERDHLSPGGSIYGSSSNGARSAFLRAKNRSPIKGLYCVGGSAHPGGGLPLVGMSAEITVEAIENSLSE